MNTGDNPRDDAGPDREATGNPTAGQSRRDRLVALVDKGEFVSIRQLAQTLGVSQVTVRADIDELARGQGLRRVRGGVMRRTRPYEETPYEARSLAEAEEKEAIGTAAAALVESNATLILDVGTTTMAMARALVARTELENVTVFTNGVNTALTLEKAYPRISTIVIGGTLRPLQHSLVDPMASVMLQHIRAGTAYIGCNGVDADFGVTGTNLPEVMIKQVMMRSAMRTVVLADTSKFGRATLARICALQDIDCFMTGRALDPAMADRIREAGAELLLASSPRTP